MRTMSPKVIVALRQRNTTRQEPTCYTSSRNSNVVWYMPSQPTLSPEPERSPKDIPQLTDAYRKAHKAYVLASGLLASWELIGITLDTKGKWGIELKSPNAVPLILFTLVFYSAYKMTIEWLQCKAGGNKVAKFDYWIAHLIALSAILISAVQYLTKIQIVDFLGRPFYTPEQRVPVEQILFLGIVVFVAIGVGGVSAWKNFGRLRRIMTILAIPFGLYLVIALLRAVAGHRRYWTVLTAVAVGAILAWLARFLLSRTQAAE